MGDYVSGLPSFGQNSSVNRANYLQGHWLVPGVHAIPTKWETETEYFKQHLHFKQFDVETRLLEIANRAGCAPNFTAECATMTIRLRKHNRLPDWLEQATEADKLDMRHRVLHQIRKLHAAGVCHRDLKAPDIVLEGNLPLLVDFELGIEIDRAESCFDLLGPHESGISLPEIHAVIGLYQGVWWNSPTLGLRSDFGPLTEAERKS